MKIFNPQLILLTPIQGEGNGMCNQSPFSSHCESFKHDQVAKSQHGHQKQIVKESSKEDASSSSVGSSVRDDISEVECYHRDTSVG